MKPWVAQRMETFLPKIEALTVADEEEIAALCVQEIQAWRDRPGLRSELSLKEPLKDARNALRQQIVLTDANSYVNRKGVVEHIALKHLTFEREEWRAMSQASVEKFHARLVGQLMIRQPDELIARIGRLLASHLWEEIAAGLSAATGRRLVEVLKVGVFAVQSRFSVLFEGQLKSDLAEEYEIPTLVEAPLVVSAWQRLRRLRDFADVEANRISSSYGQAVKAVVNRTFADLIDEPADRSQLYTHLLRAVYPRLAIHFFLPEHVHEVAFVAHILGHQQTGLDGEQTPNYGSSLYYMSYKILGPDGTVDGRSGVKLAEPGVEILKQFQIRESKVQKMADDGRTKIGVKAATKAEFDGEQKAMGCATADEAVAKLVVDHKVYRALSEAVGDEMEALFAMVMEAREIAKENETPIESLRAALADKKRFRGGYEKRAEKAAERDLSSLSLDELKNIRTPEASHERWRRAVDQIMAYNEAAAFPELRWFINAASVKGLVGGRGTEIGQYLKEERQAELDEHHKKHGLRPGHNHARSNIRERVLGESSPGEEDEV